MIRFTPGIMYQQMLAECAGNLRSAGFVRRGGNLRKFDSGNVAIISFQKSVSSNAGFVMFTVNIGIVCGRIFDGTDDEMRRVNISDAHLWERIGMLLPERADKWWQIDSGTNISQIKAEILTILYTEAEPYIRRYLNDADLVALWEGGLSPGLTEIQRLRYLSKFSAARMGAN